MRRLLAAAALAVATAFAAPAPATADPQEAAALHALFERQWEANASRFPEDATYRGDLRFNDRLTDLSPEAIAAHDALVRQWLEEARAIRRERLDPADRLSLDLFTRQLALRAEQQAFAGYRTLMIGALGGAQNEFAGLMRLVPVRTALQAEQALQRMAAYPRLVDQQVDLMRRGMALGWVPARPVLERSLAQIDDQLAAPVESGPFSEPFRRLGSDIAPADQAALRARAHRAIADQVLPALRRLRAFIAGEYLGRAPANGALSGYPDGARVYEYLARRSTTTSLAPAEIHAIGQRELAAIRAEMDAIVMQVGFDQGFAAFVEHLNTDPRYFHRSPDELLAGYRAIAKRIDAELPRLFAQLPRAPYGVRAMPSFQGPDAAEYYEGPALDGTRAGFFNANTLGWRTRPTWKMATLTAHEAVPGHHLQIARSVELGALPQFRRAGGYTAFVEGWAVYAETLGREIGVYDDPYSLFGHLQWQAFRAARLVVDTGIHSQGWSRQQAIDFMVERTGMERGFVTSEVDRYTSIPGQALGYMIGKLKIAELRKRAAQRLGSRFDVRRFHNAVIDQGALPLDVLERVIDDWIAEELARG